MSKKPDNPNDKAPEIESAKPLIPRNYLNAFQVISILRYYSNKENPIAISKITELVNEITSDSISPETVTRHLNYITDLEDLAASYDPKAKTPSYDMNNEKQVKVTPERAAALVNALVATAGGYVRFKYRTGSSDDDDSGNKNPAKKGAANRIKDYYFDPLINGAEFELIKGALTSNRYILSDELHYLVDVLHMLRPKISELPSLGTSKTNAYFSETLNKIQKMPVRKAESPISVIALNKVNTIYDAIRKECQLKLTYGVYSDMYGRIKLVEDNVGERIVNPYAMIWSNGQQYLIATDADDEKNRIFHFRIDRIYKIELNLKTKKYANGTVNSIPRPVPRDKCPEKLKPFFKKGEFQDGKYRNTFPQMSFSDDNASVDVLINCRKRCLAVLVDNFSQDDSYFIAGETIQANNRNLNLPHPNDEGYTIRIKNVDYNAIKRLCLQMQDDIYVIEPAKLRNDIIKELKAKLDIYEKL